MIDRIPPEAVRLLQEFEDWRPYAYPDPASELFRATPNRAWGRVPAARILETLTLEQRLLSGAPWTIGWGFTKGVQPTDGPMSEAEGEARKLEELAEFAEGVDALLTRPANDNQFGAMVVLAYNIGVAGFAQSTVLRAHNRGDFEAAARAFALWNKAKGRVMRGLTRRRAAEAALYLKPVRIEIPVARIERERLDVPEVEIADLMPQTVDPERSMGQSRIVQASTAAGGLSALGLAAEGASAVGQIRYSLGDWLPYVALAAVIGLAGWIVWERLKQRRGGWA